ncbi:MAG TPA: choice-of-anchor W domain-containing protein [Phycisphaerales bacterium]
MRSCCLMAGAASALAIGSLALAAPTVSGFAGGDAAFLAISANSSLERAVTEARSGTPGNWAGAIWSPQGGVGAPQATLNHTWSNGAATSFSIVYDGASSLTFTLAGNTISVATLAGSFTDIFVRVRSVGSATVSVSDLDLVGSGLSIGALTVAGAGVDYLRISNSGSAFGAFMITGKQTMSWTGPQPGGSQIAAQFKFTNVIPSSGTLSLAAVAGLLASRRRR